MIKTITNNDIASVFLHKTTYIGLTALLGLGLFTGFQFNISLSDGVALNSPYNIGYILGLLSLLIILIATISAFSLLFKEKDANFDLIVFTAPIRQKQFAFSRFLSFYILTVLGFLITVTGFVTGLEIKLVNEGNTVFHLFHFIYPFVVFGCFNALFVCMILFLVSHQFQNKLLVAICGLALYILYMIVMLFSNAPFMAQSLPQSLFAQKVSALADPFGLSAYFMESKDMTIIERNTRVVPFTNYFAANRLIYLAISFIGIYFGGSIFSFSQKSNKKSRKQQNYRAQRLFQLRHSLKKITPDFTLKSQWSSIGSFLKIDCLYLFKSIPLLAIATLLLFYTGVEIYSDIDMGIRFPENYASSGLIAQTINGIFHTVGAIALVYFVNDMYWRSEASGFAAIQSTTFYSSQKLIGHFLSLTLLVCFLTILMLTEGILFQIIYDYPTLDWNAYWGVVVFNTLLLLLMLGFLLLVNQLCQSKNLALAISVAFFLLFVSPISKYITLHSLFRFLSGYSGTYSDFVGYGPYLQAFLLRLCFGYSVLGVVFTTYNILNKKWKLWINLTATVLIICTGLIGATIYLTGYKAKDKDKVLTEKALYEKAYRKYDLIPQPTVKKVITQIDLSPDNQSYTINGTYTISNLHKQPVDSFLISIPRDFDLRSMTLTYGKETFDLNSANNEVVLSQPILSGDSAKLSFQIDYQWVASNGHQSYNAIVANGSFSRISQYFPLIGYDEDREIKDIEVRRKYDLKEATAITPLEADRSYIDDMINLELQVSTANDQMAIGVGKLKSKWQENGRNYFQYEAKGVPFRFAVSSAQYEVKRATHNGTNIEVYYHPDHRQNVKELIDNTALTLDYCTKHFGAYPFKSVVFAEISSFTQGFNGTSYPGVIYMTENMAFHANVKTGGNQDVINELAAHEVAHFWWGNSQISPDYREGYILLTEGLAMYTEMMIYKLKYGNEKMMERLAVHEQIYNASKGFHKPIPLIKATGEYTDIAYSKGAMVFVELSQLIGENTLNSAIKNFLNKHKYPNPKPISTDLLHEILEVSPAKYHQEINELFWGE